MASQYLRKKNAVVATRAFASHFDDVPMGAPDAILGIMEVDWTQ